VEAIVFPRWWLFRGIYLGALLYLSVVPAAGQDEPKTADDVINRYLGAIGAERFASITTFEERGETTGNPIGYRGTSNSAAQPQNKEHGTFEFYYKSPNLRYASSLSAKDFVLSMHGCDGKVSWYIDPYLKLSEFKPKPGNEYECENGLEPDPLGLRRAHLKMRLTKKKEIEGHAVWEVKVEDPKLSRTEHYYFDVATSLLFRRSWGVMNTTYSDYREVAGIKVPFTTVTDYGNLVGSKVVSTVREVRINAPIDDARFVEPHLKNGVVSVNPGAAVKNPDTGAKSPDTTVKNLEASAKAAEESAKAAESPAETNSPETSLSTAPTSTTSNLDALLSRPAATVTTEAPSTSAVAVVTNYDSVTEVNFPNFTSCKLEELQLAVPDLKGLKPAVDQGELASLLDKVGATTVDIAQHTPNLISDESVTESVRGRPDVQHNYDYLIVNRLHGNVVALNEYRVDLKTGDKFETDSIMKDDSAAWSELERASQELSFQSGGPPASRGFATSWVYFYPNNYPQAAFRYLGRQQLNGKHTLVLAFAQKPELVNLPAIFRSQGRVAPMFLQGVAWVDPSDFRILRLRTDLLAPVPEVSLHRLTADIEFATTKVEDVESPLWLPHEVAVTSECGGTTLHEVHKYSKYRLFRAKSRIVLNP
jgi:hypothetical protein